MSPMLHPRAVANPCFRPWMRAFREIMRESGHGLMAARAVMPMTKKTRFIYFLLCYHRNSFDAKFDRRTKKFIFFLSYFSHHPCYGHMTVNTHIVFFALIGYVFGWIKTSCVSREFLFDKIKKYAPIYLLFVSSSRCSIIFCAIISWTFLIFTEVSKYNSYCSKSVFLHGAYFYSSLLVFYLLESLGVTDSNGWVISFIQIYAIPSSLRRCVCYHSWCIRKNTLHAA